MKVFDNYIKLLAKRDCIFEAPTNESNTMSLRNLLKPQKKSLLIAIALISLITQVQARTYYSRTSGGLWTVNSTWSTVAYGNATNLGTYPQRGDVVFIGDGYTVIMNVNAVVASVTIGQGVSGELQISPFLAWTMTIAGTLTVNSGGRFVYSGNNSRTHSLFVSGSIVNNGTIDLYSDANDLMNITFNSRVNSVISGSGTFDLNRVTLYKGTSTAYTLDVQTFGFENGIRQLVITYGTYIHNNTRTYSVNTAFGDFTLPENGIIQVPQGTMHMSPSSHNLYLEGKVEITGGSMRVGTSAGTGGIAYSKNGTTIPELNVSAGSLEVYGAISNKSGSTTDPFIVNISGGTVRCQTGTTKTSRSSFQINDVASSSFTMSGGNIVIANPNLSAGTTSDFNICGSAGTVNVTAGTVEFGISTTSSGAAFNFTPYPNAVLPNLKITGNALNSGTLYTSANSTSDFKALSLYIDANKSFDINSITGTAGSTKTMQLTDNFDGINAFYNDGNFIARSSTVLMQAIEGQWISGTSTTTFYNLSINNPFGISLGSSQKVSNLLTLTDGIVFTSSSSLLTITSTGTSTIGSSISYIDGPIEHEVASTSTQTLNIPIGKFGAYRPIILAVRHNTVALVTYTSEAFNISARALGYTLPSTLGWVSDVRHYTINRSAVANLINSRITLSYGPDDVVTDYSYLRVAHDDGATGWVDEGGVGTANGSGNITSSNFSSFNRLFTIANASGGSNPLPVEFIGFDVKAQTKNAVLSWSTASEKNADYYEIQKSFDGQEFYPIGYLKAAGNSNTVRNYQYIDELTFDKTSYYRIQQVDFDGEFMYTEIKSLKPKLNTQFSIVPNPASQNNFSLILPKESEGKLSVAVHDYSGRLINNLQIDSSSKLIEGNKFNLSQGIYFVSMIDEVGNTWENKLVIQ